MKKYFTSKGDESPTLIELMIISTIFTVAWLVAVLVLWLLY